MGGFRFKSPQSGTSACRSPDVDHPVSITWCRSPGVDHLMGVRVPSMNHGPVWWGYATSRKGQVSDWIRHPTAVYDWAHHGQSEAPGFCTVHLRSKLLSLFSQYVTTLWRVTPPLRLQSGVKHCVFLFVACKGIGPDQFRDWYGP